MGAQRLWTCHADAAADDFGFRCEIDRREGLRRTHAWYEREGWYAESEDVSITGANVRLCDTLRGHG